MIPMKRIVSHVILALCALGLSRTAIAGPADLLDQAIEENQGREQPEVDAGEVADIVARADRLFDQKSFSEAVRLYESAYRLAPDNRANFARMLVARRAAGLMTDSDREALSIIEEQQRANVASTFRGVRLSVIQSQEALGADNFTVAERLITNAEFDLRSLPADIDAAPYWRQLTQLRKTLARKRGYEQSSLGHNEFSVQPKNHVIRDGNAPLLLGELGEDDGAGSPTPDKTSVVASGADTGAIIDVDQLLTATQQRLEYDRDLDRAIAAARADMLLTAADAALPPSAQGDMTFPDNWVEKSARRSKYRDGMIYRTPDFTGPDGQTYYTAIYDLGDLVHPVPNFYAPWALSGWEQRVQMEDRAALRNRSQIFGGYADDLAAGLPLLHFFGGVDNNAVSTRTDPRESQRVVRMIEQFMR